MTNSSKKWRDCTLDKGGKRRAIEWPTKTPFTTPALTRSPRVFGQRCKALHSLCMLHGVAETILKSIKTLMCYSYEVAELRNRIVHDPWYFEHTGSGVPGQFKAMPYSDRRHGHQEIQEAEITDTLEKIQRLKAH